MVKVLPIRDKVLFAKLCREDFFVAFRILREI